MTKLPLSPPQNMLLLEIEAWRSLLSSREVVDMVRGW
jgi:hypothetical protein